ncbi:Bax inhibitor-1 family protein [Rubellicoccus peritrichatus]|uniref:Bax inhibitor-1 family protein n=1 Tax=Rubellicoccus peritrichatus TaxID=3080537 RepID=A0AAQ3LCA3_9BACT|nr:Bax inhibitor-1 family protein [Puniceicoccus sp. CR14]WOO43454.1 Bax inhibitor-1 family protein [Puniceicoccus sp. CR14]
MNTDSYPVRSLADAAPSARALFIRRTYIHLAFALLAFVGLEAFLLQLPISAEISQKILSSQYGWLMVLGGFLVVGWLARGFAANAQSKGMQYLGLGLYVVLEALIFVPLLLIAIAQTGGTGILVQAGVMTGLLFAGLTATAFITRKDFSWMRSALTMGFFVALGLIIAGVFFGFDLGFWFSAAMILLASGAILYTTSNIIHHYGEDQYVAASLELFAAVALLLWYVVRILMSRE